MGADDEKKAEKPPKKPKKPPDKKPRLPLLYTLSLMACMIADLSSHRNDPFSEHFSLSHTPVSSV
jgi:hypothetical protein